MSKCVFRSFFLIIFCIKTNTTAVRIDKDPSWLSRLSKSNLPTGSKKVFKLLDTHNIRIHKNFLPRLIAGCGRIYLLQRIKSDCFVYNFFLKILK